MLQRLETADSSGEPANWLPDAGVAVSDTCVPPAYWLAFGLWLTLPLPVTVVASV